MCRPDITRLRALPDNNLRRAAVYQPPEHPNNIRVEKNDGRCVFYLKSTTPTILATGDSIHTTHEKANKDKSIDVSCVGRFDPKTIKSPPSNYDV